MPSKFHPRSLEEVPLKRRYGGAEPDALGEFYVPCLSAAIKYDRAVGYFRASLLATTGIAYSDFAQRGGKLRLVCGPSLNRADVDAAIDALRAREYLDDALRDELETLIATPENRPLVQMLGALVTLGTVEIRVASRHDRAAGIYHEKVGIFSDDSGNSVSFEGSSNETWSAWDPRGNVEGFSVFATWRSADQEAYVNDHRTYFDALWEGRIPGIDISPLPEAVNERLVSFAPIPDIDYYAEQVVRQVGRVLTARTTSLPEILESHQVEAINSWVAHNYRGIVNHATGAGKTLTALEAIRQWTADGRPAVVVVPTVVLQEQWQSEIRRHLPDTAVLPAGGTGDRSIWQPRLGPWTAPDVVETRRVVLATMATASSGAFTSLVRGGDHLLVVVDEVHGIGSPSNQKTLAIEAGGRLGLSATPDRYRDPEGTAAIYSFFGVVLEPVISLEDAVRSGRLVPYTYDVKFVSLNDQEQEAWDKLTDRIVQKMARVEDGADPLLEKQLKMLLIQRSRITKKAESKIAEASVLVASQYEKGQSWLVYCEDQEQMNLLSSAIRDTGLNCDTYHSALMKWEREAVLDYFRFRGGVLIAIRCLDEGVDIPAVDHGLILASSQNPRQFIQRRGRVLRKAPGKYQAAIHDIFVLPSNAALEAGRDAMPIIRAEIQRAHEFAGAASNRAMRVSIAEQLRRLGIEPGSLDKDSQETEPDREDFELSSPERGAH